MIKRSPWLAAIFIAATALSTRADTTLVFNEIMYHPKAGTNEAAYEWVELYNQLAVDLDVSGWKISGDINFKFPEGTRIAGRSFLVVAADPTTFASGGITNLFGPVTNRLSNGGASLELHNGTGRLMDEVNYGTDGDWPIAPDGSGVSLAKVDRDFGSKSSKSWTWSREVGGTPGADNFGFANNASLVTLNTVWKFNANGTDPDPSWRGNGYDDSAWGSRYGLTNSAVPTLFNTGVGTNGVVQAANTRDPHYFLTAAAQGPVNTNALVIANHPSWLANDASSSWIGVLDPGSANINVGAYNFQTTFSLSNFIPGTVQVGISVAVDNDVTNVYLNGVPLGLGVSGFASLLPLATLTSGFNTGLNTIEFFTSNAGTAVNPGGFRAQFTSSAVAINTNAPLPAGLSTYYFRTRFRFTGAPDYATLTLTPVFADGAVFYLNGVEVYRQNMPAGAISYSTPALSQVAPGYSGPITISGTNLVTGTNVLAVEIHQATGRTGAAIFGADLLYSSTPVAPTSLTFNELSASTNAITWIELMNSGATPVRLDAAVLHDDASGTNYEYVFPASTTILPGGFVTVTNSTLGFTPVSGDKLFLYSSNRFQVFDAVIVKKGPRARWPDGSGEWLMPSAPTPSASNSFSFHRELVINEIMYDHHDFPGTNGMLPQPNSESWIEIYNRGTNMVDLTGWEINGGISFKFPLGKAIAPGGYLVVAKNALALRSSYPAIDIIGDFDKSLSHGDDSVTLTDPSGNPASSVHYRSSGRWPEFAAGGGSSLELRDPNADNSSPEAWAASDESHKMGWQTYGYRMVAAPSITPAADTQWREFVLGMLGGGECLIDDISVIQNPDSAPLQFVDNGNFESGIAGWRVLGNHRHSQVEVDPDNPNNHVLHVIASGPQEHMHNHIETTLSSGRTVANGSIYQISYRARWVGGNTLLNTRLYWDRCARTTALPQPLFTGTPGARNSQFVTNIGPSFARFQHLPVVPKATEPVTVSVAAQDPQGVSSCQVWWSVNGGSFNSAAMTLQNGLYAGTIPAQPAGAVVQFYVRAVDALGAASTFPAAGPNAGALYKVDDGLANLALTHNFRIIMTPANTSLMHADTNVMSNETLPCTVIYDERHAYYDMRVRLKSSERGRNDSARVGFHLEFPPDDLFRGVHPVLLVDRSGGGGRPAQEEIVLKHIALKAGLHEVNSDVCRILPPQTAQNGSAIVCPRFEDEFIEASFHNGGDGTLFELELTYYPTTVNGAGYKLPQPDAVQGADIADWGLDKEAYRYNFIIKNHRSIDDYSRFINFARIWSASGAALDAGTKLTMDMDEWLRTYAVVSLCGVGDMYTFGNNHNFMTYIRPSDGKVLYFPWDMDFSFSQGATAALVGNMNLGKIVSLPPNLRRFYAHILDIINAAFNTSYMTPWLAHYGPFSGQSYAGDASYIQQRGDFAKTTIAAAGGNTAFSVSGPSVQTNGNNYISISGTAPVQVTSIQVNGAEYPITWSTISAWTMNIPLGAASNNLNIVGYDLHGNPVATNSTHTVYYTNAVPDPRELVMFSEIMYNPAFPDAAYVELYNASPSFTFDLGGWRINGLDFTFPSGTVISNSQFAVVAANPAVYSLVYGNAAGSPVGQFSGALQMDGETLTLIKPGATSDEDIVIDKVRYDGGAPWPAPLLGSSLQLVDARQDNARVGDWVGSYQPVHTNDGWRFVSFTATFGSNNRFLLYLDNVGSVVLDDIYLVAGTNAEAGVNYIRNGGFESPLGSEWTLGTNMTASSVVSSPVHSGAGALRLVQSLAGSASVIARDLLQTLSPTPTNQQVCTLSFWYWATNNTATNLSVRVVSSTLTLTTNIGIFVIPATNLVTPGTPNYAAATLPPFPSLWLNEVQADNVNGRADNNGEHDPWIEIYNSGTNWVALDELYLSSGYSNLTSWAFPAGVTIPPHGFQLVWCDGQPGQTAGAELHTSFRLPSGSGSIALSRLYNGGAQVIDYLNYHGIRADRSYGSFPDGQPFDRIEFVYPTPGATNDGTAAPLAVYINEWMASNTGSLADPADGSTGAFDDWFELYNPGSNAVDIAGYYLTDALTNKFQYLVTTNVTHIIPPGGHLLVWADNQTGQNTAAGGVVRPDLHVNFQLSKAGEQIALFASDGTLIDAVTFGPQTNDLSQGRFPDGSDNIIFMPGTASPRAANYVTTSANNPPVLDPIGNKVLFVGQTLTFTATAHDSDIPAQALTFSLDPGAPEGASISSDGAFSWTPVGPGTYGATVRVTDNGVPALSASRTIAIEVYNAPRFHAPSRNSGNLELTWDTQQGHTYRIEYKDDLSAPGWTLLQEMTASGGSLSVTNATGASAHRFFRVVAQ